MGNKKSAVFIGHRNCPGIDSERMMPFIEMLIAEGIDTFYNGGMGQFDRTAAFAVNKLKTKYPNIKNILVIPYQSFRIVNKEMFDEIIMPFAEQRESNVFFIGAIPTRNHYMVESSSYALCYVSGAPGGATDTYKYAQDKGLKLFNLYNLT